MNIYSIVKDITNIFYWCEINMEIYGILGHQGVGKNYLAEKVLPEILPNKQYLVVALADHFKIDAINKHGLSYDKVYGKKDFKTRKKLQEIGTEEGRYIYGDKIWINTLETWMTTFYTRGIERFIIPDLRFQNEVNWIKKLNGTVIKIVSEERFNIRLQNETNGDSKKIEEIKNHPSESGIDKIINFDFQINNDLNNNIFNEIRKYI